LWTAIKTIQKENPEVISVIYSGDIDVTPSQILENVEVFFVNTSLTLATFQYFAKYQENPHCSVISTELGFRLPISLFHNARSISRLYNSCIRSNFLLRPRCLHRHHGLRIYPPVCQFRSGNPHGGIRSLPDHLNRHAWTTSRNLNRQTTLLANICVSVRIRVSTDGYSHYEFLVDKRSYGTVDGEESFQGGDSCHFPSVRYLCIEEYLFIATRKVDNIRCAIPTRKGT